MYLLLIVVKNASPIICLALAFIFGGEAKSPSDRCGKESFKNKYKEKTINPIGSNRFEAEEELIQRGIACSHWANVPRQSVRCCVGFTDNATITEAIES